MSLIEIIVLAIALGIDCLVVSFSQGLILKTNRVKNSIILALTMGLCQGLMPYLGYFGAESVSRYITPYAKWLVFGIFLVLGIKFIKEAFQHKEDICDFKIKYIISMGIATSIDALASGVNLNLTQTPLIFSTLIIGLVSFTLSLIGFWLGNFFKQLPSKSLEITGGIILIALALKSII